MESLRRSQVYDHLASRRLDAGFYLVEAKPKGTRFLIYCNDVGWEAVSINAEPVVKKYGRTKHDIMQDLDRTSHL